MDNPFNIIDQRLKNIENFLEQIYGGNQCSMANEVYLKIDKASDFLSTSPNALRVMVHKNQIPFIKKQGKLFFRQKDLIQWLESGDNSQI